MTFSHVHKRITIEVPICGVTQDFEKSFLKFISRLFSSVDIKVNGIVCLRFLIKFEDSMHLGEFDSCIVCLFEIHSVHDITCLFIQPKYHLNAFLNSEFMFLRDVFSMRQKYVISQSCLFTTIWVLVVSIV